VELVGLTAHIERMSLYTQQICQPGFVPIRLKAIGVTARWDHVTLVEEHWTYTLYLLHRVY